MNKNRSPYHKRLHSIFWNWSFCVSRDWFVNCCCVHNNFLSPYAAFRHSSFHFSFFLLTRGAVVDHKVLCFSCFFAQMSFSYCVDHFTSGFGGFVVCFFSFSMKTFIFAHFYCFSHRQRWPQKSIILSTVINHRLNWSIISLENLSAKVAQKIYLLPIIFAISRAFHDISHRSEFTQNVTNIFFNARAPLKVPNSIENSRKN